jgi:TonB family protein
MSVNHNVHRVPLLIATVLLAASVYRVEAAPRVAVSKHVSVASAIYTPRPNYPMGALARYEQGSGWFVMRVQIKSGRVKEVEVARSTGHSDLDASTVDALKRWRFKPNALSSIKKILPHRNDPFATEDALVKVPVSFELQSPTF